MHLIIILAVALYFTINAVIFLVWTEDGFTTKHKGWETLLLFFFGLPFLVIVFIIALIISLVRRDL